MESWPHWTDKNLLFAMKARMGAVTVRATISNCGFIYPNLGVIRTWFLRTYTENETTASSFDIIILYARLVNWIIISIYAMLWIHSISTKWFHIRSTDILVEGREWTSFRTAIEYTTNCERNSQMEIQMLTPMEVACLPNGRQVFPIASRDIISLSFYGNLRMLCKMAQLGWDQKLGITHQVAFDVSGL